MGPLSASAPPSKAAPVLLSCNSFWIGKNGSATRTRFAGSQVAGNYARPRAPRRPPAQLSGSGLCVYTTALSFSTVCPVPRMR